MPLVEQLTLEPELKVWLWHLTESEAELTALFAPEAAPSIPSVRTTAKRREEYLATQLLLNHIFGTLPALCHTEQGRPYLSDREVEISISHTRHYVAVATHPTCKIGVDVESIGDKAERISSRFLTSEEHGMLSAFPAPQGAVIGWSAKESLFKALNRCEIDFKKHLRLVHISPLASSFVMQEFKGEEEATFCGYYRIYPTFVLTLIFSRNC